MPEEHRRRDKQHQQGARHLKPSIRSLSSLLPVAAVVATLVMGAALATDPTSLALPLRVLGASLLALSAATFWAKRRVR